MGLLRAVGFFHGNMFLFSVIIGAGIFVSPQGVLKYSSMNIPVSLCVWVTAALMKMMNALCLAELATTFPVSAAPYYVMKRCLGPFFAFLNLWISIFGYSLGISAQSLLIANCLIQPFYSGCPAPGIPKKCLAVAILWLLGILNARGVTTVSWFNTISSLMKMAVLCFISLTGIVLLVIGKRENVSRFENLLDAEFPDASQIAEAMIQGSYAYAGSSLMLVIAGEIKNPAETIPKSFIFGLSTVAVFYVLTNISYLAVLSPQEIISSDSVAGTWMDRVFPSMQWVISFAISISILNSTACAILSASRVFYTASQEGQLPFIFSMLNNYHCPVVAVIKIIIFSSIAAMPSNLVNLIKYLGLVNLLMIVLNMVVLIKLRYQEPHLHRPYKVWLPFIIGSMVSSLFLLVLPMFKTPTMELIYQANFLLSGFLCYWLHILLKQHSGFFDKITCYLQLLLNVFPPENSDSIFMH